MNLTKAIEIGDYQANIRAPDLDHDFHDALKLLIEAGKQIQYLHEIYILLEDELLPGETKG